MCSPRNVLHHCRLASLAPSLARFARTLAHARRTSRARTHVTLRAHTRTSHFTRTHARRASRARTHVALRAHAQALASLAPSFSLRSNHPCVHSDAVDVLTQNCVPEPNCVHRAVPPGLRPHSFAALAWEVVLIVLQPFFVCGITLTVFVPELLGTIATVVAIVFRQERRQSPVGWYSMGVSAVDGIGQLRSARPCLWSRSARI